MLNSIPIVEQRALIARLLKLNETRDEDFNHVLPPSTSADLDALLVLAPMLPLSALQTVCSEAHVRLRPIISSPLSLALVSGAVDYVDWFCCKISAHAVFIEVARDSGAFLELTQVAAMAKEASCEKVFKPYVQGLRTYVQKRGWSEWSPSLFRYVGWSKGCMEVYAGS
ncbi:uncharacterized protein JCM15063_006576 [Sporobolomyces koalae]|uniref:uncharacterized protein n=1 Tax=Sporobolomyces koalae TaxID=500713 RepID=UPI00317E5A92